MPYIPTTETSIYNSSKIFMEPFDYCIEYLSKTLGGLFRFDFLNPYTGSRIKVLEEMKDKYYFNAKTTITNDLTVTGKIVNVNRHTLLVEVGGVEEMIDINEIAPFKIPNLKEIYKPGELTEIYIKELEIDHERHVIRHIELSKKIADRKKYKEIIEDINIGDIFHGTVFDFLGNKILVWLDLGITVLINYRPLHILLNDKVGIRITYIDYDNLRVFGSFI